MMAIARLRTRKARPARVTSNFAMIANNGSKIKAPINRRRTKSVVLIFQPFRRFAVSNRPSLTGCPHAARCRPSSRRAHKLSGNDTADPGPAHAELSGSLPPPSPSARRERPSSTAATTTRSGRRAPRVTDFKQFQPRIDADPSFRTEFRVAYDDRNLYVFTRMFDPHPDSIMHALTRRDVRGSSDQIKLLIDSYNDKRSGFEFAVNPDGVKRDFSMSNDGNEDDSWDGVWDVATRVDSLGWTAEFRIPLSQLRYAKSESNTFGFGVWRDIERLNERESLAALLAHAQRTRRRSSACSRASPASRPAAAWR